MLRWTLLGDLVRSLRVRLGFNRSRISEKIHYSELFSAGKIKQNQKTANKPTPKSQAIFSFLFLLFPLLYLLCMNCATPKCLKNSEIRTCPSHPQLQLGLVLDPPRRKAHEGSSHVTPLKPAASFNEGKSARNVAHAMGQGHFIIPSNPLPLLTPKGVYGSSTVIFTILLPLRSPRFLHRVQLFQLSLWNSTFFCTQGVV